MVIASLAAYHNRADGPLRVITYNRRRGGKTESLRDTEVLRNFCDERNIAFRWMDPPHGYYAGEVSLLVYLFAHARLMICECPRIITDSPDTDVTPILNVQSRRLDDFIGFVIQETSINLWYNFASIV